MDRFWLFWRMYGAKIHGIVSIILAIVWFVGTPCVVYLLGYDMNKGNAVLYGYFIGVAIFICIFILFITLHIIAWGGDNICPSCCMIGTIPIGQKETKYGEKMGGCYTDVSGYCDRHNDRNDCEQPTYYLATTVTTTCECPYCGKKHDKISQVKKTITYEEYQELPERDYF